MPAVLLRLSSEVLNNTCRLGIGKRRRTHRGCRAGRAKTRRPPVDPGTHSMFHLGLLDCHSACNKPDIIKQHVTDYDLDMLALTETWFKLGCNQHSADVTPHGYKLVHAPRKGRRGGGVGLLHKSGMQVSIPDQPNIASFESLRADIVHNNKYWRLIVVYKPPPSKRHRLPFSSFITDFTALLDQHVLFSGNIAIVGDFNVHWDDTSSSERKALADLLDHYDMKQVVSTETHQAGHTIDLVIVRSTETLVESAVTTDLVSDHYALHCSLNLSKPKREYKVIRYRKLKSIDSVQFGQDIQASAPFSAPAGSLMGLVEQYDTVMCDLMDKHAPVKST